MFVKKTAFFMGVMGLGWLAAGGGESKVHPIDPELTVESRDVASRYRIPLSVSPGEQTIHIRSKMDDLEKEINEKFARRAKVLNKISAAKAAGTPEDDERLIALRNEAREHDKRLARIKLDHADLRVLGNEALVSQQKMDASTERRAASRATGSAGGGIVRSSPRAIQVHVRRKGSLEPYKSYVVPPKKPNGKHR